MATLEQQLSSVRKVFGENWTPSVSSDLQNKGILGAVRVTGTPDVFTIGEGGKYLNASDFKKTFGTDNQQGIVGEISAEQAKALGIVLNPQPIKSLSTDELTNPVSNTELTDLSKATEANVFNNALKGIQESIGQYKTIGATDTETRQKYLDTFTKSDTEKQLESDIARKTEAYNQMATDIEKNILGLEGQGRGITTSLISGQQAKLYEQGQLSLKTLQNEISGLTSRLGIAQSDRENQSAGYKALLDFDQQDKQTQMDIINAVNTQNMAIVDLFQKYNTAQKEKMSSLMQILAGVNPSSLSTQALNQIASAASSIGITGTDAVKALQANYDSYLLEVAKSTQRDTQVVERNGRIVIIDMQTGEVISDLGAVKTSGGGGGSTATERLAAEKQAKIDLVSQQLMNSIGEDGFANTAVYAKLMLQYPDIADYFPADQILNPNDATAQRFLTGSGSGRTR